MSNRKKPIAGQPFFACISNGDLDGTIKGEYMEIVASTFEQAEGCAKQLAEEYGTTSFIYRCEPTARIEPLPRSKTIRLGKEKP